MEKLISKDMADINEKLDSINLSVYPIDYDILTIEPINFTHDVTNIGKCTVVCRVRATSSQCFKMINNVFVVKVNETYKLQIIRSGGPLKSHRIVIEALPLPQIVPDNLHYIFNNHMPPKQYKIRYHKAPTWYSNACQMMQNREHGASYPNIVTLAKAAGLTIEKDDSIPMTTINILNMATAKNDEFKK